MWLVEKRRSPDVTTLPRLAVEGIRLREFSIA